MDSVLLFIMTVLKIKHFYFGLSLCSTFQMQNQILLLRLLDSKYHSWYCEGVHELKFAFFYNNVRKIKAFLNLIVTFLLHVAAFLLVHLKLFVCHKTFFDYSHVGAELWIHCFYEFQNIFSPIPAFYFLE